MKKYFVLFNSFDVHYWDNEHRCWCELSRATVFTEEQKKNLRVDGMTISRASGIQWEELPQMPLPIMECIEKDDIYGISVGTVCQVEGESEQHGEVCYKLRLKDSYHAPFHSPKRKWLSRD